MDDSNPYLSPREPGGQPLRVANPESAWKFAIMGALWSVVSAFPIAGLMAFVFRFPVPFAGYLSGFEAIVPAMMAVFFYGVLMGGLVLVGSLGAIAGAISAKMGCGLPQNRKRTVRLSSLAITTVCVFALAILDKFIGPW